MNPLGGAQEEPSDDEFNPSKHFEIKPSLMSKDSPKIDLARPAKKTGRVPLTLNVNQDKGVTLMPSLLMSPTAQDAKRINTMQVLEMPAKDAAETELVDAIRATPELIPVLESLQYEMMKFPSIEKKNSFREILQGALEETIRPSQVDNRLVSRSELMTVDHNLNAPKSSIMNVESHLDVSRSKLMSMASGKSAINKSGFSLKSPSK